MTLSKYIRTWHAKGTIKRHVSNQGDMTYNLYSCVIYCSVGMHTMKLKEGNHYRKVSIKNKPDISSLRWRTLSPKRCLYIRKIIKRKKANID